MENESLLGLDSSPKDPIQTQIDGIDALFKAAKVGNIKLMWDFLAKGADPFALDEKGHDAIFYANLQDSENTAALLLALRKDR